LFLKYLCAKLLIKIPYHRHVQSDTERYFTSTEAILAFVEDSLPTEIRERTKTSVADRKIDSVASHSEARGEQDSCDWLL
jgi:hypothetical protein